MLCNKQPQKPLWQLVKCQGLTGGSGRQLLWSWRSFFSLLGDGWRLLDCVGWPQQWSGGWAWGVSALFCMFLILQKTSSGMSLWSNKRNLQELLRPRLKTGTCHSASFDWLMQITWGGKICTFFMKRTLRLLTNYVSRGRRENLESWIQSFTVRRKEKMSIEPGSGSNAICATVSLSLWLNCGTRLFSILCPVLKVRELWFKKKEKRANMLYMTLFTNLFLDSCSVN